MGRYILKRIGYILLVFLVLSFLVYFIYNLLPIDKAAETARAEVQASGGALDYAERLQYWREQYGEDGALPLRYLRWLGLAPFKDGSYRGLLQGNLGRSVKYARPVIEVLKEPMGNTVLLNLTVTLLSLAVTVPLGVLCALKRGSRLDTALRVGTVVGYSLPVFILAIVFIRIFSVSLGIFPVSGMETAGSGYTGLRLFFDRAYHLALPVFVMVFCSLGGMTRYVRSAMSDAMAQDHIRTARAKGLSPSAVIWLHGFRNALIPLVTLVIGWFLSIFSGSLMIENIFALNGIGKVYYDALVGGDSEVALALQTFYILVSLVGNLLTDLAYGFLDPRIRVGR